MSPQARTHKRMQVGVGVLVAALAVAGIAACSSSKSKTAASTTTTAAETTTSAEASSTDGTDTTSVWQQNATAHRGQNGQTFTIACTPNGTLSTVWGVGPYTDDSSICTAAVQSGLITLASGGKVTYEIAAGQDHYDAGTGNDVTSQSYGSWPGSFTLPDAAPGTVSTIVGADSWSANATSSRGKNGTTVTVKCSPNGTAGSVWGSGPYTDDSSICTAAVHAGLITLASGGTVVIQIAPGQSSYSGSTANGITTSDYGQFEGSYTFPKPQPGQ